LNVTVNGVLNIPFVVIDLELRVPCDWLSVHVDPLPAVIDVPAEIPVPAIYCPIAICPDTTDSTVSVVVDIEPVNELAVVLFVIAIVDVQDTLLNAGLGATLSVHVDPLPARIVVPVGTPVPRSV
jgi:hypothetical protein